MSQRIVAAAEERRDKVLQMRDILNQRADKAESTLQKNNKELNELRDKYTALVAEVEVGKDDLIQANSTTNDLMRQLQQSAEEAATLQERIITLEE